MSFSKRFYRWRLRPKHGLGLGGNVSDNPRDITLEDAISIYKAAM